MKPPSARLSILIGMVAALCLMLGACATPRRNPFAAAPASAVWPLAPEPPRIQYVTSIHSQTDLFESGGFFTALVHLAAGEQDTRLVRPFAIAVHPEGGVLVADTGAPGVHFYDIPRRRYRLLGRDLDGGLTSPVGVAVAVDGSILVADSRRATIERFNRDGRHAGAFAPAHRFVRPGGVVVDPVSGEVFACDVLAHHIVAFSPGGDILRVIGSNGSEPGQFNFPTHLALDGEGGLLVADSMNFRIQRLALDGTPLAQFGEVGNARGNFARPKGVAPIGGQCFVAVEGLYDSLIFFDAAGRLLLNIGEAGSGPGEFWLPAGLTMDSARGLLFVADSYNSRVQVFRILPRQEEGAP